MSDTMEEIRITPSPDRRNTTWWWSAAAWAGFTPCVACAHLA
jgi:hypothetical protein